MEIFGYVSSVFMGLSLGMIGGGGSILTVPILVYLFSISPEVATAYSLFIVGSTAFVGGIFYYKKGDVDLKTGFVFALPSFIGVYLTRAYVMRAIKSPIISYGDFILTKPVLIMFVFALLMLAASFSMIKTPKNIDLSNEIKSQAVSTKKIFLIALEGLIVGGVTGFVGAGGGFLIIPALVILVGMPMKKAVGTSLFIIASKSLIGFIGDLQQQSIIQWNLIILITMIAALGLILGTFISKNISEKNLKRGFGYFVLIMGSGILLDQLRRLH